MQRLANDKRVSWGACWEFVMFGAAPIVLDDETRAVLETRVRAAKTPVRDAVRARIILLAADGMPSRQISQHFGMHHRTWRSGGNGFSLTGWPI